MQILNDVRYSYIVDDKEALFEGVDTNQLPIFIGVDKFQGGYPVFLLFDAPPVTHVKAVAASYMERATTISDGNWSTFYEMS